jgi:signal peptide peptidase SppA
MKNLAHFFPASLAEQLADPRASILAVYEGAVPQFMRAAVRDEECAEPPLSHFAFEGRADYGVAVISVSGPISPYFYDAVDPRAIASAVAQLTADPGIHTIIHDIDSPGGHATYVRELGQAVRDSSQAGTRNIAYVGPGNMAASAAYWYAAAADEIVGSTASMPGSIGVFSALYDFSAYLEKEGVKLHLFRDGALKGMGLFGKELTPEESAHIQAGVDKVSLEFKSFIRARRPGIADATMQGQVFDGDEAIAARLLDRHVEDLAELVAMEMR